MTESIMSAEGWGVKDKMKDKVRDKINDKVGEVP